MAYSGSTLLSLPVITTGTESGKWGDITNNGLTQYLDISIAGALSITSSVTLANTSGSDTATNIGATTAQYRTLVVPASGPSANVVITAPSSNRTYHVVNRNATYTVQIRAGANSGVTFGVNQSGTVTYNAVSGDYELVGTIGPTVPVARGGTGLTSGTSGGVLYYSATGTLASSGALAASAIVLGGGAGVAPATTTTGTGVVTAVGNAVNTTGGLVTQSGTLASSAILLGGGASTAITSTTTGTGVVTAVGNAVNTTGGLVTQSGTLASSAILLGGGASTAITSTTTGTGVVTAIGNNTNSANGLPVLNGSGNLGVAQGGTGAGTLTANNVILGNGTSAVQFVAPGTAGNVLTSDGTTWISSAASGNVTLSANNAFTGANTFYNATGQAFAPATTNDGIILQGRAGGSSSYRVTFATATLSANRTLTFPDATDTAAVLGTAQTFTALQTFSGSTSVAATKLANAKEVATISATAATGTINYDITTQSVLYYTSNASANWTVNFRGSSGTSLNTLMSTGESMTVAFLVTQGSTAYYNSAVQVDGSSVTPKYQGGTAWSAGNASSIDAYVYTIVKTGSAAFTVFASQTKFA